MSMHGSSVMSRQPWARQGRKLVGWNDVRLLLILPVEKNNCVNMSYNLTF